MTGYITISRKLFEHELFAERREFSRFESWLDLIQLCAYEQENCAILRGRTVRWGRGQKIASVRYLQERWKWKSTKKVFSFLELLRSHQMIETDNSQGMQRITLCNYDSYNSLGNTEETESRTRGKQWGNKIKEYKEVKEIKESIGASPPMPKSFKSFSVEDFQREIEPHRANLAAQMLDDFYNYWTEKNAQGRMKFQLQPTWETAKRIATWVKNEKKFANGPSRKQTATATNQAIDTATADLIRDLDEATRKQHEGQ